MRFSRFRWRTAMLGSAVVYGALWAATATLGARAVEAVVAQEWGTLTGVRLTAPCPFVVHIDHDFDHALALGSNESSYLWFGAGALRVSHVPGPMGCKIFGPEGGE